MLSHERSYLSTQMKCCMWWYVTCSWMVGVFFLPTITQKQKKKWSGHMKLGLCEHALHVSLINCNQTLSSMEMMINI